ncbi:LPP20 family lipoprotein [Enterovibrio sp. ZSDZ42]|uniref:LPP20 family lipoprotein n=1 Tax=Enterovibrio gelatinilyticus TaxID=2899819 RepID=A0ABT5QZD3_9GAMM|nr:LPP20 family lipoprotein [Enterovibrio sp. ZSDZ42]MDD1793387.1 LPP20 family lipoprotein [Enterovibrio sp. ZSDZ42]
MVRDSPWITKATMTDFVYLLTSEWFLIKMIKKIYAVLLPLVLVGCQSTTPPDWYNVETVNDPNYIYSVGEGRSLNLAKKSALGQINEQLWTQVDSSFTKNDSFRKINDGALSYENVKSTVNAKSAQLTLIGTEYLRSEQNDVAYYVQARVKRDNVKAQILTEIDQIESNAEVELKNLSHQDRLTWWLENNNLEDELADLYVRIGILSTMNEKRAVDITYLPTLVAEVDQVKSSILVYIKPDVNDKKSAAFIAEKFGAVGINTTTRKSRSISHILIMNSDYRKNMVGDAFITTKVTELSLRNINGQTLSTSEVISTGNSVSNFKLSHEGAERHFSSQIEEKGIWTALGLQL